MAIRIVVAMIDAHGRQGLRINNTLRIHLGSLNAIQYCPVPGIWVELRVRRHTLTLKKGSPFLRHGQQHGKSHANWRRSARTRRHKIVFLESENDFLDPFYVSLGRFFWHAGSHIHYSTDRDFFRDLGSQLTIVRDHGVS